MITNKEPIYQNKLSDKSLITLSLSLEATHWLAEYSIDNSGKRVSNYMLFHNLLCRATPIECRNDDFRRPQMLQPGQFQFSEISLSREWNVGRKKAHNILLTMQRLGLVAVTLSRVASIATVTCVNNWDKINDYSPGKNESTLL